MASQQEQINEFITQFMTTARESLSEIITSLESDQLLQQMRNDENLYKEKLNYIKELIKQHFTFEPINPQLIREINELKISKIELESRLEDSKEEYIAELSNIEVQYQQFLLEKENQKRQMEKIIEDKNQQIFMLNKNATLKNRDLENSVQNLRRELQIIKDQQNQLRINNQLLSASNEKLTKQVQLLKKVQKQDTQQKLTQHSQLSRRNTQLQSYISELLLQNKEIKEQLKIAEQKINLFADNEQQYLETIQKMKEHMFLIKEEWEKKCMEVQADLSENYRNKLIEHEEEMNDKLRIYMEELKMGKSVIIQSSHEILESKRALMQQQFDVQIQKYTQELKHYMSELNLKQTHIKQLETLLTQAHQNILASQTEAQQVKSQMESLLKNSEETFAKKQEQLTTKLNTLRTQSQKQIQRLRKTQNMFLKDLKASKLQKQDLQKDIHSIRQEFNALKQKLIQQSHNYKRIEQLNEASNTKILQLKKDLAILNEKSTMDEKSLKDKNNEIFRLQNNINQLKNQYKELDTKAHKLDIKLSEYNLRHKQNQRAKGEMIHRIQKLFILVRKLAKQLSLVKQDIQFEVNLQKGKSQAIMLALNNEVNLREQNLKYNHKMKIKDLLQQVEGEKKDQREELHDIMRQNENMKKEIKLMQQLMREKEEDHHYERERAINLEVQKCRILMQEDIAKQRDERRKLQEKLYNQQKRYDYMIAKAEKQVFKQVKLFMAKWESKIAQNQQTLQFKQKNYKQTAHNLKRAINQLDTLKNQLQQKDDKLTRQQKKYESLKQQRDKTIDQMMRRLEKQTKHKINLQKEMKQIRGEIIKTQTNNNNTPFNNYSFTDRQNTAVYTNAFQTTPHQKMKTHVKTNHREKELSQIREMIAKTYKVMEVAEKGSPVHKGKLF